MEPPRAAAVPITIIPRITSETGEGFQIPRSSPVEISRLRERVGESIRKTLSNPESRPPKLTESQRLELYPLLDEDKAQLLNVLRGDKAQFSSLFSLPPFKMRPESQTPALVVAFLYKLIVSQGPKNLKENLQGLLYFIHHFRDQLQGYFLQHLFIENALKLYPIKKDTKFWTALVKLSHLIKQQVDIENHFPSTLSANLTPDEKLLHATFLDRTLEVAFPKTDYNTEIKQLVMRCLQEIDMDEVSETGLLRFLIYLLPPMKGIALHRGDRKVLNRLCFTDGSILGTCFEWCKKGFFNLSTHEWLKELLESGSSAWKNVYFISVYLRLSTDTMEFPADLLKEQIKRLSDDKSERECDTDPDRDDVILFCNGFANLKQFYEQNRWMSQWINNSANLLVEFLAELPHQNEDFDLSIFTILSSTHTLQVQTAKPFAQLFKEAVDLLKDAKETKIEMDGAKEKFYKSIKALSEKMPSLFSQVEPGLFVELTRYFPSKFDYTEVAAYLRTVANVKQRRAEVTVPRETLSHLMASYPGLRKLIVKDTNTMQDLDPKWIEEERQLVSPSPSPKLQP